MSKKHHSRPSADRRTGEKAVQSWASRLGDQSKDTYRTAPSATPAVQHSRSVQPTPKTPKNIVLVRYVKGKDNLIVEDKVTHEVINLTPGDSRHVHMNTVLMKTLKTEGFELEVV